MLSRARLYRSARTFVTFLLHLGPVSTRGCRQMLCLSNYTPSFSKPCFQIVLTSRQFGLQFGRRWYLIKLHSFLIAMSNIVIGTVDNQIQKDTLELHNSLIKKTFATDPRRRFWQYLSKVSEAIYNCCIE